MIEVDDRVGSGVPAAALIDLVGGVLAAEGAPDAEVGILLVDADEIRALNRAHRGLDEPTDVLAFPIDEDADELEGVPRLLGDVVVCVPVALAQASDHGRTPGSELGELVVHGVLHLLAYDHEVDDGEMLARQADLVAALPPILWAPPSDTR